jgi:hypothetical protein
MINLNLGRMRHYLNGRSLYYVLSPHSGNLKQIIDEEVGNEMISRLVEVNRMHICQEALKVFLFETQDLGDNHPMVAELCRNPFPYEPVFVGLVVGWSNNQKEKKEKTVTFPNNS